MRDPETLLEHAARLRRLVYSVVREEQARMATSTSAVVNESDWSAARGDQWRTQLSGMEPMLAPIDEPLIRALELDAPCTIADIGCGGGGTALEILRRAPAGSVVHGFDLSPPLIELARGRAPHEPAIAFDVADMATAEPGRPYDRLVSRFGVMFFGDPLAAFANLVRWLEPGGRFAFASSHPSACEVSPSVSVAMRWSPELAGVWVTARHEEAAPFASCRRCRGSADPSKVREDRQRDGHPPRARRASRRPACGPRASARASRPCGRRCDRPLGVAHGDHEHCGRLRTT
jgi:SAM-dependent methyltransferase